MGKYIFNIRRTNSNGTVTVNIPVPFQLKKSFQAKKYSLHSELCALKMIFATVFDVNDLINSFLDHLIKSIIWNLFMYIFNG